MEKSLIVYRINDPFGNKTTLFVNLRPDNTFGYGYYGGWQSSGMPYAIANMQLKKSLPIGARNFKRVDDLDQVIWDVIHTGVCRVNSKEILNDL